MCSAVVFILMSVLANIHASTSAFCLPFADWGLWFGRSRLLFVMHAAEILTIMGMFAIKSATGIVFEHAFAFRIVFRSLRTAHGCVQIL
jgi:hypothetical protein